MEEEILDANLRLNQATAIFLNIIRYSFEFPEAWVTTSRLYEPLFVGLTWLHGD